MTAFTNLEALESKEIFKEMGVTDKHRLAWVDKDIEAHKENRYFETVLKYKGSINAYAFSIVGFGPGYGIALTGENEDKGIAGMTMGAFGRFRWRA